MMSAIEASVSAQGEQAMGDVLVLELFAGSATNDSLAKGKTNVLPASIADNYGIINYYHYHCFPCSVVLQETSVCSFLCCGALHLYLAHFNWFRGVSARSAISVVLDSAGDNRFAFFTYFTCCEAEWS